MALCSAQCRVSQGFRAILSPAPYFSRVDAKPVLGFIELVRSLTLAGFGAICLRSKRSQVRVLPGAPVNLVFSRNCGKEQHQILLRSICFQAPLSGTVPKMPCQTDPHQALDGNELRPRLKADFKLCFTQHVCSHQRFLVETWWQVNRRGASRVDGETTMESDRDLETLVKTLPQG